jgi:CRP-like cAMP-binding protein
MNTSKALLPHMAALSTRLSRLVGLDTAEVEALRAAEREQRRSPARRELIAEGEPLRDRRALLSGWACRQRILSDGRRQTLGFLLPGDLIGVCHHSNPLASTSILAITDVIMCPAPTAAPESGLAEAYARSAALEEHYFLSHITRLGRLDASERLADWLLETQERLALVGLPASDQFPLPLTQEMLADALGLTSVHVNRTLQAMRRDDLLTLRGGMISFSDRDRLEKMVDYRPARVSLDS